MAVLAMALSYSPNVDAQGFLKNLGKKVVEKAKQKVADKILDEEDKAADAVLNGESDDSESNSNRANAGDADAEEVAGNEPIDFAQIQAKSDFKRGATVFFEDDLSGEQMGEFPSKWDLLNGSECEVVSIKGKKAIKIEKS